MSKRLKTVMICDDEQDVLLTYAAMLKLDYTVVTTSSGSECIKSYFQRKQDGQTVHVILVDFKLGDMTGDEVARKIKLLNGTKIVLISAYDIDDNVVNALKEDNVIVEFLKKPVTFTALREAINRIVQS